MTPTPPAHCVRIVSGGQTGVDRAALDGALESGLAIGGWCPRGRRAEDGAIPDRYPLLETPNEAYPERTEWNVRDSDVTLIVTRGDPDGGTALTLRLAKFMGKPVRVIDLESPPFAAMVRDWLQELQPAVINVAGPRESSQPGIYLAAKAYLIQLFASNDETS
ncbi:MAG: putative molybdenum carrier protein [Gemmataceae bacterium]|nr:putative molybdenum carrier protein [Gemmataceae bacterium]